MLESDAAMLHAQKMANGEVEYQAAVRQSNDKGWKDEFVLILVSLPILLLIWSVFSDDPMIQEKIEVSCYWCAELICSGHYMELWELLFLYYTKYNLFFV